MVHSALEASHCHCLYTPHTHLRANMHALACTEKQEREGVSLPDCLEGAVLGFRQFRLGIGGPGGLSRALQ